MFFFVFVPLCFLSHHTAACSLAVFSLTPDPPETKLSLPYQSDLDNTVMCVFKGNFYRRACACVGLLQLVVGEFS